MASDNFIRFIEIPIDKLVKADWNYKNDDISLKEKLKENIKRNGQIENLIVRELKTGFYEIVNGNHRYDALLELGFTTVIACNMGVITLQQAQRIAIETNETRFTSDNEKLAALLQEITAEFDKDDLLATLPYDELEYNELLNLSYDDLSAEDLEDLNELETPELPLVPKSKLGDLYIFNGHRLLCGDSKSKKDVELLMNGQKADMIFTDPPYNVKVSNIGGLGNVKHTEFVEGSGEMTEQEFINFLKSCFVNLCLFSKNGSIHYVCMDWKHIYEITTAGRDVYNELKNLCVWNKDNGGMGSFYRSKHELIFVFKNGDAKHINTFELGQHGRYRTNVWDYAGVNSFTTQTREGNKSIGSEELNMHPTCKPINLIRDAILDCSLRDNIILDLFMGSGTTFLAADSTNRIAYGMELDPKYCDVIIQRYIKYCKNQDKACDVLVNGEALTDDYFNIQEN